MSSPPPSDGPRDATPAAGGASGWEPGRDGPLQQLRNDVADLSHRLGLLSDRFSGIEEEVERVTHVGDPAAPEDYRGDLQQITDALSALGNDLAEIGEAVNPADKPGSGGRAVTWVDLDQNEAEAAWRELAGWMRFVLVPRYGDVVAAALPRCWYRHPIAVEQLSWLRATWVRAYRDPEARPTQAAEWHARWLPTVISQLRDLKEQCGGNHRGAASDADPDRAVDDGGLEDFWRADVAGRPPGDSDVGAETDRTRATAPSGPTPSPGPWSSPGASPRGGPLPPPPAPGRPPQPPPPPGPWSR